ncbi:uncharacterized protein LOC141704025 [Apium graveolens]|uniref:uncharacterized protein LOC141704025 n=1 Tax=Apium graveolens TaxID=4045 RepID=UPI003D79C395
MTQLMRKGIKFEWNDDREKSFQELKKGLMSAPILVLPSGSGGFRVYSDASKRGLGCVLMQHGKVFFTHLGNLNLMRGSGGSITSLKVEPNLVSRVKEVQKNDTCLEAIRFEVVGGKQKHFCVDDEGVIWLGSKLCVPADPMIREEILKEAHSSSFSIHPGSTKMYGDLKKHFWWSGMNGYIAEFVGKYLTCQQVKIDHQRPSGLWQQLDIPCRAPSCWDEVGERVIEGPKLVRITNEKVEKVKKCLKEARSRQKSYANQHRKFGGFEPDDNVFLKVSPCKSVKHFGMKGKLSPRYVGPFDVMGKVGDLSYRVALPPQLSHVHNVFHVSVLRGYKYHPLHVVQYPLNKIRGIFLVRNKLRLS